MDATTRTLQPRSNQDWREIMSKIGDKFIFEITETGLMSDNTSVLKSGDCERVVCIAEKHMNKLTKLQTWTPITERWPDKSGHYLVTYHEWTDGNYLPKYDEIYIKILRYQDAVFRLPVCCDKKAEDDTHREVLAWQPLPEPYKEG